MHARAGIDRLLPVVRHMVGEPADERVRHQSARRDAPLDDLRLGRLLHQAIDALALAAPADPLAPDVPVHEELRRHDVQSLADVLAHPGHRLAAVHRRAVGVGRLVVMLHPAQVLGQRLPARRLGRLLGSDWRRRLPGLQLGELRLQVRLVLDQRLQEELSLLRIHRLGARAELPALEPRQLERDLLDLRVPPHDLAIAPGNLARLLLDMHQHALRQGLQGLWRQAPQVLALERVHVMHALMLPARGQPRHRQLQQLRPRHPLTPA